MSSGLGGDGLLMPSKSSMWTLFTSDFNIVCCIAPHFHIKPTVDNPEGHKLEQRGHKPGHLHHVCMLRLHCVVIEGI